MAASASYAAGSAEAKPASNKRSLTGCRSGAFATSARAWRSCCSSSGGSAAVATGSATTTNTGSGTGSAAVLPAVVTLTLSTTPDGAEIFINSAPTGKKTPATLQVPKTGKVTIGFRLKGYEDLFLKEVALDSDTITKQATLKKTHTGGGTGHGSAHGTGKGSAKPQCDTYKAKIGSCGLVYTSNFGSETTFSHAGQDTLSAVVNGAGGTSTATFKKIQ